MSAPVDTLEAEPGWVFPLLSGGGVFLEAGAGVLVSTKSFQKPQGGGATMGVSADLQAPGLPRLSNQE